MWFEDWVELAGKVLDATGVLVITGGIFVVTVVLTARRLTGHSRRITARLVTPSAA